MSNNTACPRCGEPLGLHPALSRADNRTEVCSKCGTMEALWVFLGEDIPPVDEVVELASEEFLDPQQQAPPRSYTTQLEDAIALVLLTQSSDEHALDYDSDGDGWNEPFSDHYECICGEWSTTWVQKDPECSDRPAHHEVLLVWQHHVETAWGISPQDPK